MDSIDRKYGQYYATSLGKKHPPTELDADQWKNECSQALKRNLHQVNTNLMEPVTVTSFQLTKYSRKGDDSRKRLPGINIEEKGDANM